MTLDNIVQKFSPELKTNLTDKLDLNLYLEQLYFVQNGTQLIKKDAKIKYPGKYNLDHSIFVYAQYNTNLKEYWMIKDLPMLNEMKF